MKCRHFERKLSLFQKGELPDDQRQEMEAHAQSCGACRALSKEDSPLNSLFSEMAHEEAPEAPQGLEHALVRRWRDQRVHSRLLDAVRARMFRPILIASLALNTLAVVALGILFAPRLSSPSADGLEMDAPSEMLTTQEMRMVFGEMESFFGPRLDWVAAVNQDISLGVLNGPDTGDPETCQPVALLFTLESAEDGGTKTHSVLSTVILARPSLRQRKMILGEGDGSMEIRLSGLKRSKGHYLLEMRVRPLETLEIDETAQSFLSSRAILLPGEKAKLGQIRMGNNFWNVTLSVRPLGKVGETLHG